MTLLHLTFITLSCLFTQATSTPCSLPTVALAASPVATPTPRAIPEKTGPAVDVELSAKAAFAWDVQTGTILYEYHADEERPIASLNKLLSTLTVRQHLPIDTSVLIPPEVRSAQQEGADVQLPIGQHVNVRDLLAASLIPSANDAMVSLAIATAGTEEDFVKLANQYAADHGLTHTKMANSTGLSGGDQYSTAHDVQKMISLAYRDDVLRPFLSAKTGRFTTTEGTTRSYKSTDKLLGTYVPILAAKTGYTVEAGENLVVITQTRQGQPVGAIILGSQDRFQDMKILLEWLWRNYSWPT